MSLISKHQSVHCQVKEWFHCPIYELEWVQIPNSIWPKDQMSDLTQSFFSSLWLWKSAFLLICYILLVFYTFSILLLSLLKLHWSRGPTTYGVPLAKSFQHRLRREVTWLMNQAWKGMEDPVGFLYQWRFWSWMLMEADEELQKNLECVGYVMIMKVRFWWPSMVQMVWATQT